MDMEESSKKKLRQDSPPATAASLLTNDLILEVLSHLPARSVRRFKCVSTAWRDLIADTAHRKKLPQTLASFLYNKYKPGGALSGHFASVSGGALPVDPSLHFLQPSKFKYIALEDTCNGLLLCACYNKETPDSDKDEYRHVVCNPATERWIELPPSTSGSGKQILQYHTSGFRSGSVVPFPRSSILADHFGCGKLCQRSRHLLIENWSLDS
jgi:hypothetical protein